MTISPTLSEQFSALVNLAVVTNVIPYIVSLSALIVMMRTAKVRDDVFRRNAIILVIAMAYSVFALYASGKDAVMGGVLVLGITYIVWGFLAPRFMVRGQRQLSLARPEWQAQPHERRTIHASRTIRNAGPPGIACRTCDRSVRRRPLPRRRERWTRSRRPATSSSATTRTRRRLLIAPMAERSRATRPRCVRGSPNR